MKILPLIILSFVFLKCSSNNRNTPISNTNTANNKETPSLPLSYKDINITCEEALPTSKVNTFTLHESRYPMLIFRHNYYGCEMCTDSVYHLLVTKFKDNGLLNKVFVLSNYPTLKDVVVWRENFPELKKVYHSLHAINIYPETQHHSYFFIYDPRSRTIQDVHFPDKSNVSLTESYLKSIAEDMSL